jgi:hypothetical protein
MDFFVLNRKSIHQTINSLRDSEIVEGDTAEIKTLKFKTAIHCRHDLLHLLVSEVLGEQAYLGVTRPISRVFSTLELDEDIGKLTPDIVIVQDDFLLIIDVSITTQVELTRSEKIIKYNVLSKVADLLDVEFRLHILSVKPSLDNLIDEGLKLDIKFPEALLNAFFFAVQ